MNKEDAKTITHLVKLGFSFEEASQLCRISNTLRRWFELECGNGNDHASWAIERDEETEKPYLVTHPHTGKSYRTPVRDREAGARKRLEKIMAEHPEFIPYVQTDPRGCSLYIIRKDDVKGLDVSANYTRGLPV